MKLYSNRMIPPRVRAVVRQSRFGNRIHSIMLAKSRYRLDIIAAQVSHVLHMAGVPSLKGKVCLEIGSGWTLTHALVFHLIGAKRIIATDISPLAQPSTLTYSIRKSVPIMVRNILSPFSEHSELRARLDNLFSIKRFNFDTLKEIGIEYIAPFDYSRERLNVPVDFVYSFWVLEYVPIYEITPLLENLTKELKPGGKMLHSIHLEDHRDYVNYPFAFYSESEDSFQRNAQGERVNRIRKSQWVRIFNNIKDLDYQFLHEERRLDRDLPAFIDPSIVHEGEDDLRISHIEILGTKK